MERCNPFVKCLAILSCGLILAFGSSVLLNLLVLAVCLALLLFGSRARLSVMGKLALPALLAAASIFFTGLFFTNGRSSAPPAAWGNQSLNFEVMSYSMASVYNAAQLSTRILAYAGLGVLFALTTDGERFVQSLMHQCRLPPQYAYGVLAAFHLMPAIGAEYRRVRLAYRVRGLPASPLAPGPVFTALVNVVHWSENVAMAMESKGFDGGGPRSCYIMTPVRWFDWGFLAAAVLLPIAGCLWLPF